jgi:acyl carrier protein
MSIANDVEPDIVEYVRAHHGVEADQITDESTLDDLGLDSLGVLAIADIVEAKYGISLDDERIAGSGHFRLQEFSYFLEVSRSSLTAGPRLDHRSTSA